MRSRADLLVESSVILRAFNSNVSIVRLVSWKRYYVEHVRELLLPGPELSLRFGHLRRSNV